MPNLTLKQRLYQRYWQLLSRYLDKRQPAADKVRLVQKLIFILPTRYGWWFVLLITLLYLLGTNYQNNLILLLCYLLLSVFLVNIVLAYQNISGLTLQCKQAAEGFAGEATTAAVNLSDDKKHLMLNMHFVQPDNTNDSDTRQNETVLLSQPATTATLNLNGTKRGKYALPRIKITSQYPFGLWRAWSYIALAQHYWVYPNPDADKSAVNISSVDASQQAKTDAGETLSPYRAGDSVRHMVWKRLARDPANPVVRQQYFSAQAEPSWVVVPPLSGDALERALRYACRQLLQLEQSGSSYGLKLPALTLPQAKGPQHLQRCLQELALC
ncbi:DUF58 domain-containing protein [Rheinheimera hassiensis]|uniref:DUF58 domain-containing protein n=1 Tax=Rheinheimera hassiensis TaxID=1193627 RepID=UPI001F067950|nr:DUF58 domain-containing protein [Rheinheimera hassiensis]